MEVALANIDTSGRVTKELGFGPDLSVKSDVVWSILHIHGRNWWVVGHLLSTIQTSATIRVIPIAEELLTKKRIVRLLTGLGSNMPARDIPSENSQHTLHWIGLF